MGFHDLPYRRLIACHAFFGKFLEAMYFLFRVMHCSSVAIRLYKVDHWGMIHAAMLLFQLSQEIGSCRMAPRI